MSSPPTPAAPTRRCRSATYDPNVIKRLDAIMVRPDVENARKWYQLAADRGSAAASLQLANLKPARLEIDIAAQALLILCVLNGPLAVFVKFPPSFP